MNDITLAMEYGLTVGDVIYNVFGNLAKFALTDPMANLIGMALIDSAMPA